MDKLFFGGARSLIHHSENLRTAKYMVYVKSHMEYRLSIRTDMIERACAVKICCYEDFGPKNSVYLGLKKASYLSMKKVKNRVT
jgi:hypothetical protein